MALARTDGIPGSGSVQIMDHLYMAFCANAIDHIIESTPNEVRYYIGYVGWRPGELKSEIGKGPWSVIDAYLDVVFRNDTEGLWGSCCSRAGASARTCDPRCSPRAGCPTSLEDYGVVRHVMTKA